MGGSQVCLIDDCKISVGINECAWLFVSFVSVDVSLTWFKAGSLTPVSKSQLKHVVVHMFEKAHMSYLKDFRLT